MNVTPYNFNKPGPLGPALEQGFAGWLRNLCPLLTRKWAKQLTVPLEMRLQACDLYRAGELVADLGDSEIGYGLSLCDAVNGLTVWPRTLALALVGAILSDHRDTMPADRELTAVEESLFAYFLQEYWLPTLQETWPHSKSIKPSLGACDVHPRWTKLFKPDDIVVGTVLLLKGPFGEEEFRWIAPKHGLLAMLDSQADQKAAPEAAAISNRLQSLVQELPVDINIVLGSVELDLAQLAHLRAGDIIVLNQRVTAPLVGEIAGEPKLRGWSGRVGNQQAFQIEAFELART